MRRVLSIRISYHLLRQKQLQNGTGYGGGVYAPEVAEATTDCREAAGEVYLSALFLASSLELSFAPLIRIPPSLYLQAREHAEISFGIEEEKNRGKRLLAAMDENLSRLTMHTGSSSSSGSS